MRIPNAFEELFCLRSNFSNLSPGLKTGVENDIFWSKIGSGFGEPGDTPAQRIPRSTPPGSREMYQ